jgi:hypothetical protein
MNNEDGIFVLKRKKRVLFSTTNRVEQKIRHKEPERLFFAGYRVVQGSTTMHMIMVQNNKNVFKQCAFSINIQKKKKQKHEM